MGLWFYKSSLLFSCFCGLDLWIEYHREAVIVNQFSMNYRGIWPKCSFGPMDRKLYKALEFCELVSQHLNQSYYSEHMYGYNLFKLLWLTTGSQSSNSQSSYLPWKHIAKVIWFWTIGQLLLKSPTNPSFLWDSKFAFMLEKL